ALGLVSRTAGDSPVATAVADRRGPGIARDAWHAEHHEHDWRPASDGNRGEKRDPADRFRQMVRGSGHRAARGMIQAGRERLRPILMTTFALIAGMIPVALGSGEGGDFRAPLGIAVIGGGITSTLLTLLVIPTVYEILADGRDWLAAKVAPSSHPLTTSTQD